MKISLLKDDKLLVYKLPARIEGNIWLSETDNNGIERNIINVEATPDGKWKLISNSDYYVSEKGTKIPFSILGESNIYTINHSYSVNELLMFTSPSHDNTFKYYQIKNEFDMGLAVGRNETCGIAYVINYVGDRDFVFRKENERLYIEVSEAEVCVVRVAYTNELTRNSKEQIKLVCGRQENHYIDNIFIDTHDPEENYDPIILAGAIKDIAWAYENEIRIRADVAGTRVPDAVYVDIPDYVIKSMEITAGPMFFGNLEYRLREFQSLCLNLNYSHFHNNLQHMPCYEYMSINEMINNTSEKPKDPCPEKQALLSGSKTVPLADQISLLSFSGMGVFRFHNTGELYIGADEYRFTIRWHRKGAEIILDHQAGTSPYITTIPPAHSLSSFTFCSTPSISALNRPVIIVNKNKRVIVSIIVNNK